MTGEELNRRKLAGECLYCVGTARTATSKDSCEPCRIKRAAEERRQAKARRASR